MIIGDYEEREIRVSFGKKITAKVVKSPNGVEYAIGPKLGAGGVARVFSAFRVRDKKECVFKEYVKSPEKFRMHSAIKNNITNLMDMPLTEDDGVTPLRSFVGPMDKESLIPLPASGGFGYIMELVDTKAFLPVPNLWHNNDTYPNADILCKACADIATFFRKVHLRGWCYKDINEGNIYINNKTGEVRIIDCDNLSGKASRTIKGTDGYMAPEVYVTSKPDSYTDYFSMAVLFYRLLVGGYPMDGKKTMKYLLSNGLSVQEAASEIYGTMALFAFDPKDKSNEIRNFKDPSAPHLYESQTKMWDRLPEAIQNGFIKTFSTGLANENRHLRVIDIDWINIFKNVGASSLVRCRSCGRMNFGNGKREGKCVFCSSTLPKIKSPPPPPPPPVCPVCHHRPCICKTPPPPPCLSTVKFRLLKDIVPTQGEFVAQWQKQVKAIYPGLNDGWMIIRYNPKSRQLAAENASAHTWLVKDNGVKTTYAPGAKVILKTGLVIAVLPRQLQLTVMEIK